MPLHMVADSWLQRHDNLFVAIGTVVLTVVVLVLVNRAIGGRGGRLAEAVTGSPLSSAVDTRLRILRRVIDAAIIVIGVVIALSQFQAFGQVASTLLTSGAIAAAVFGFAARQVLANGIAGVLLAVTQPIRIGDRVTFEDETGTVEDVRLTTTWLRTPADQRVIIPNERLAAGVLRNDSILTPTVTAEASLWLPPGTDVVGSVDALRAALAEVTVAVAESHADGTRLTLAAGAVAPGERVGRENGLREAALRALAGPGAAAANPR